MNGNTDPWTVDAADPALGPRERARLADRARPDRMAWNAFRALALWEPDTWVPALLEVACGPGNPLSALEWSAAAVDPWGAELAGPDVSDVVLDGPEAVVVAAATLKAAPPIEQVTAAAVGALDRSLKGARQAGLVLVVPPGAQRSEALVGAATGVALLDGRPASDLLAATGVVTWTELGRLALDLAEGAGPAPAAVVHQLVTDLQAAWPEAEI
ncbi:MAG: hypothetical protein AB1673_14205 [Actinomycetota bacterium]